MKMPLSEIIDRYTITLLKSERTDEDVSEELNAYKKEIPDGDSVNAFIDRMYEINGKIWDTEGDIRSCLLYTSPSPRDKRQSRMPSSA